MIKRILLVVVGLIVWASLSGQAVGFNDGPWGERVVDYLLKTSAPTASDSNYAVSTLWCDGTNDKVYTLIDNSSGAAVWKEIGVVTGGVLLLEGSDPELDFKDTDCTDSDVNAAIEVDATATGSGTEDIDVAFKQQVAGTTTVWLKADADGNLELGTSAQKSEVKGGLVLSTETVTCTTNVGTAGLTSVVSFIVSDGGSDTNEDTVSLADGVVGQIKKFVFKTDTDTGDSVNVTPTNFANGSKIVFDTDYESCEMVFDGTNWYVVSNTGGTIS